MKQETPKYLLLGEILRPHGIKGELRMRVLTDYPERIRQLDSVYLGKDPQSEKADVYPLRSMRMHKGYALLTFKDITDRDQADLLRGLKVMVSLDDAIPLDDDEVYLYQLFGMTVQTEDGQLLGEITDVLETGANDVYVVQGELHGEVLIPVTDETIIETNTDTNIVTVSLPDGLL